MLPFVPDNGVCVYSRSFSYCSIHLAGTVYATLFVLALALTLVLGQEAWLTCTEFGTAVFGSLILCHAADRCRVISYI